MRKIFILGLDSAPPKIVYENYDIELKGLREVIEDSVRFILRSSHPPITIPAWLSMFTGKTPGELGIYGFRHRKPGDVRESYIINSLFVKTPTIWDILSKYGYRVGVIGVPPTYPPRPIHGFMISDFTTPGPEKPYTFPPWLRKELEIRFGSYIFDVVYRSHEKDKVRNEIFKMTNQHLNIIKYLLSTKEWDVFIYVEIGVDRVQHAFWKYFDKSHPRHIEHPIYSRTIQEYYELISHEFEKIRKLLPRDTIIAIVSDHGVKAMKGAFVINQWLEEQGYLKLKEKPKYPGRDIDLNIVDWEHTLAWGWGGYYSRIFINLEGREPKGIVKKWEYEDLIKQLKKDIGKIKGPKGETWKNKVYTPNELYPEVKGDAPDLMVYFDDLNWRAAGTIGWNSIYLPENDRGPDDAVHDWNGILAIYDPQETINKGFRGLINIKDVFDLLINILEVKY